jgi:hypothetical protein
MSVVHSVWHRFILPFHTFNILPLFVFFDFGKKPVGFASTNSFSSGTLFCISPYQNSFLTMHTKSRRVIPNYFGLSAEGRIVKRFNEPCSLFFSDA